MLRKTAKYIVPASCLRFINQSRVRRRIRAAFDYDQQRYRRHSASFDLHEDAQMTARVTALYHVLEKGLSMPEAKPVFGTEVCKELVSLLNRYLDRGFCQSNSQIQAALAVLTKYVAYHEGKDVELSQAKSLLERSSCDGELRSGFVERTRQAVQAEARKDFPALIASRHSVRDFTADPVDMDRIREAVALAQRSPSACNRQSTHVHVLATREMVAQALELANGVRGFAHLIDKLILVTGDVQAFWGGGERYQAHIDGGMFAMSLLYALHYVGLGACCLNWSVEEREDQRLRHLAKVRDSEVILMLIGVGNLPETFKVAASPRKKLDEILHVLP